MNTRRRTETVVVRAPIQAGAITKRAPRNLLITINEIRTVLSNKQILQ